MENEKKKKSIFKRWWFWTIIVILAIGVSGYQGGNRNIVPTSVNNQNELEKQQIEYKQVDIEELEDALDKNAAAAKDTYNGQYLEITGRLGTIDSDLKYISLLSTTDMWDMIGIHCTIKSNEQKEAVKTLSKDDTIIVRGKITNVGEVLGYYLDIDEISKK